MKRSAGAMGVMGLVVILILTACTGGRHSWPAPDPDRPTMTLEYDISEDLTTATATEYLTFRPDRDVCEAVLRTWVNVSTYGEERDVLDITSIRSEGVEVPVEMSLQNTLATVALPECANAGDRVRLEIDFTLRPVPDLDERTSRTATMAWFGTAYPLLAWQNGVGWVRDTPVRISGETVTSETFDLQRLAITTSSRWRVAGTGTPGEPVDDGTGRVTHVFSDPAVRDISFVVGDVQITTSEVAGTTIHLALPTRGTRTSRQIWDEQVRERLEQCVEYLGPVPYDHIWISVIPSIATGLEMPGAAFLGDLDLRRDHWLITHELAHLWFYGLVGNNQAQDPWLDEATTSFVQQLVDPTAGSTPVPDRFRGRVGAGLADWANPWGTSQPYVSGVYLAGADALWQARDTIGEEAFDEALRGYLEDNAHQIATPEDFADAFAGTPEAVDVLQEAGALPDTSD